MPDLYLAWVTDDESRSGAYRADERTALAAARRELFVDESEAVSIARISDEELALWEAGTKPSEIIAAWPEGEDDA